jgi:hypothetical protein
MKSYYKATMRMLHLRRLGNVQCSTSSHQIHPRFYASSSLLSDLIDRPSSPTKAFRYRSEWTSRIASQRWFSNKSDDDPTNKQEIPQNAEARQKETSKNGANEGQEEIEMFYTVDSEEEESARQQESASKQQDAALVDKSLFTEPIKIRMPDMGEGDNKILTWYKQEGDLIRRNEALCLIETEVRISIVVEGVRLLLVFFAHNLSCIKCA